MGLRISQPKQAKPSDWIAQALGRRTLHRAVRRETRAAHPGRCIVPAHAGFALFPVFLFMFSLLLFISVFSRFLKSE
jgi:hypothetical protein